MAACVSQRVFCRLFMKKTHKFICGCGRTTSFIHRNFSYVSKFCPQRYDNVLNVAAPLQQCRHPAYKRPLPATNYSTHQPNNHCDTPKTVLNELSSLAENIKQQFVSCYPELQDISCYHFDGQGKSFRPLVVMHMARACNFHNSGQPNQIDLHSGQGEIAMIAEMIHTASLIHDDVIDGSSVRRGKASVHSAWGQRKAVFSGDYILAISSMMLAKIGNCEVIEVLSEVIDDLVRGEFMQLGSRENENERFSHYLKKTYKKTASLIANSCKAVALLDDSAGDIVEAAYQYGCHIGIAFQLVDDMLDFVSNEDAMGKPTAADLKLGLATAPVLFAAQEFPQLTPMIMRRFREEGDVHKAWSLVCRSNGIEQTRLLAEQHSKEAVNQLRKFKPSDDTKALIELTNKVLTRKK